MRLLTLVTLLACAAPPVPVPAPVPVPDPDPVTVPAPDPDPAPTPTPAAAPTTAAAKRSRFGTDDEIAFCIEETNRYRKATRRPPFARSAELDAFAREGARHDAKVRRPHDHFNTARFPGSFSGLAENELPWWHLDPGAVKQVIRDGLASMWAEGPGGGHYENLIGKYTEMGCGIWIDGDEITVVQDFRTP